MKNKLFAIPLILLGAFAVVILLTPEGTIKTYQDKVSAVFTKATPTPSDNSTPAETPKSAVTNIVAAPVKPGTANATVVPRTTAAKSITTPVVIAQAAAKPTTTATPSKAKPTATATPAGNWRFDAFKGSNPLGDDRLETSKLHKK